MREPFDELAMVLAGTFFRAWTCPRLENYSEHACPVDAHSKRSSAFRDCERPCIAANRREATVVLIVDQFEELLGTDPSGAASRFLELIWTVTEQSGMQILTVATLRSDFLGALQAHTAARGLEFENVLLGPMGPAEFVQVIEGPPRLAGLELGPGLAQAIVADTATQDALPLLAFPSASCGRALPMTAS
jgi:hypothetical protein